MITETDNLLFVEIPTRGTTDKYEIMDKSKIKLGEIKWNGSLRQYAFSLEEFKALGEKELREISSFLTELMDSWRKDHHRTTGSGC